MASNYVVEPIDAAVSLMEAAGIPACNALLALAPLVEATVHNSLQGLPLRALTAPIQHGDIETVRRHLQALYAVPVGVRHLYLAAGCAEALDRVLAIL